MLARLSPATLCTLLTLAVAGPLAAQPRAPMCRQPDYQEGEVRDALVRIATSEERGPTSMRTGLGITRTPLTPPDSIQPSGDATVCLQGAAAYAKVFGPDPLRKGVLVMRFGEFWVVARPDGRPGPMVLVVNGAFEKVATWGI